MISLSRISKLNALFTGLIGPQIHDLVGQPGRTVTFNLETINFIDSSGLDMLARATDIARSRNTRFELANLQPDVRHVIEMIGLDKRLVISNRSVTA